MSKLLKKTCPQCLAEFQTYVSINKKHCTARCSQDAVKAKTYKKYKRACEVCGNEFLPKRPKEGGRFCSYKCSGIASRKDMVDRGGYWHKIVESHPRATVQGYVALHTLIMEERIGRYLKPDEVVHHKDCDRKNNVIDNLQLMTASEHNALHMKMNIDNGVCLTSEQRLASSKRMKENNPCRTMARGENGKFRQRVKPVKEVSSE